MIYEERLSKSDKYMGYEEQLHVLDGIPEISNLWVVTDEEAENMYFRFRVDGRDYEIGVPAACRTVTEIKEVVRTQVLMFLGNRS